MHMEISEGATAKEKSFYERNVVLVTALTSFIPDVIIVNLLPGVFSFKGQKSSIFLGLFLFFAVSFVLCILLSVFLISVGAY